MKIGIMTCWQPDDNYGTQLQCFALQRYLTTLGHKAFLIQYVRASDKEKVVPIFKIIKIFNPFSVYKKLRAIYHSKITQKESINHNRNAPEFRNRYLNLSKKFYSYQELLKNPPEADLYIVGSDQVWNNSPSQTGQFNAFFLNFGAGIRKISYAASFGFGEKNIPKNYVKYASPLLNSFDGISVREQSGLDMIKKWGGEMSNKVIRVCDPTLLLSAKEYRSIYEENCFSKQDKKYVVLYNLSSDSSINCERIEKWAEEKGLDFVYIPGHGQIDKFEKCYASIPQWLYLIDNAEYVFTNSFHCAVFSSIFHKKFVVFELDGFFKTTNTRLDTIKSLISSDRVVSSVEQSINVIDEKIDWDLFEERKEELITVGKNYLAKYLTE